MDVEVNGIRMQYTVEGDGPTVVLLHGYTLDRSLWDQQVRALGGRYRVVAPDLRGHGGSALGNVSVSTMDQMANDVRALLDHIAIREPVVLGGLSMGGYVTFAFLRKYRSRVRALVLADTRATADTAEARQNRMSIAAAVEQEQSIGPAERALYPKLMAPPSYERPELVEHVRAMMARMTPAGVVAALRGMAARPDSTDLLPDLDCPTLVVVGEQDVLTPPSEAGVMHDGISGSELLQVPGAGHLAPLENPAPVNQALLDFLARLGS